MSEQRPKPYWLIVKYEVSRMDVLTAHLAGGEEALPVFSFEEEAGMFSEHRALGSRWRVRETTAGELISVLFGPCAYVERVALDPLLGLEAEGLSYLASMRREDFLEFLTGKQNLWLSVKERRLGCRTPNSGLKDRLSASRPAVGRGSSLAKDARQGKPLGHRAFLWKPS